MTVALSAPSVRFSADDARRAWKEWGANCGPGAIAAVCGLTLDELRPKLGDFERKRYTNPSLMWEVLGRLPVGIRMRQDKDWPDFGLVRVQWEGPWTAPGVPMRVRYRHTHWVGAHRDADRDSVSIFDLNCICVGGWVTFREWSTQVVPWLLKEAEPKADGHWHITHSVEVRSC